MPIPGGSRRRFDDTQKTLLLEMVEQVAESDELTLHGSSATATHLHTLISFKAPSCQCGAALDHCRDACEARQRAEAFATHAKRVAGWKLAEAAQVRGRRWFSRGCDVTPVRDRTHFDYLIREYLPKHRNEGGIVRIDPKSKKKAKHPRQT